MKPKFLNVDLELKCLERPLLIEKEFVDSGALMLFSGEVEGGYLSTFEVNPDRNTPEQVMAEFSRLIAGLSVIAKIEWQHAKERAFDVGYESAEPILNALKKETKRVIDDLEGIARYTTYPPSDAIQSR